MIVDYCATARASCVTVSAAICTMVSTENDDILMRFTKGQGQQGAKTHLSVQPALHLR